MENMLRVATLSPEVRLGNIRENITTIGNFVELINSDVVVTPELSLTGYTMQDLFNSSSIRRQLTPERLLKELSYIQSKLRQNQIIIVGAPIEVSNVLYNCAIVLDCNKVLGIVPKCYLPNYNEFYEARWFKSALEVPNKPTTISTEEYEIPFGEKLIFKSKDVSFGVEICEDLWAPIPPSCDMSLSGAEVIFNLSASNETIGKEEYRRNLVKQQSARCICGYVYCSASSSESTSDIVFSGHNIIAENGSLLGESGVFSTEESSIIIKDIDLDIIRHDRLANKTFANSSMNNCRVIELQEQITFDRESRTLRNISITPFVPKDANRRCREIFNIQTEALARRWKNTGSKHVVIGVSGGLDSTLALLVAVGAADKLSYDRGRVIGITMPCFGTTSRTKDNATLLMKELGITGEEINIGDSVKQHLKDIGLSEDDRSVAYENAQARERTQVLMDYTNMVGGFVVGTGDLSESALGWCTYNGDHMSMYSVNCSIPKTLVRTLVENIGKDVAVDATDSEALSNCIKDILDTPVSPELLPPSRDGELVQLTENSVGPYVLNDFFLYYMMRYGFDAKKILNYTLEACNQSTEYKYTKDEVRHWLEKFYWRFVRAQFKRNCCPDGVKVGSVSLNPRGDWRMASEVDLGTFLNELNN